MFLYLYNDALFVLFRVNNIRLLSGSNVPDKVCPYTVVLSLIQIIRVHNKFY